MAFEPGKEVAVADLFNAYRWWATAHRIRKPLGKRAFGDLVAAHEGVERGRRSDAGRTRTFCGLRLRPDSGLGHMDRSLG